MFASQTVPEPINFYPEVFGNHGVQACMTGSLFDYRSHHLNLTVQGQLGSGIPGSLFLKWRMTDISTEPSLSRLCI